MSQPTPVQIIRPRPTTRDAVVTVVADLITLAGNSGWLMLLLGACHSAVDGRIPAIGYGQTVLALVTVRVFVHTVTTWDAYKLWTKEQPRGKGRA